MVKKINGISPAEERVCQLLVEGLSYQEIANILNVKLITVKKQAESVMHKFNLKNNVSLAVFYYKNYMEGKEMPLEEYSYEEVESGRSETLVKALEKMEKLKEGLNRALTVLQDIIDTDKYNLDEDRAYIEDELEEIKKYVQSE